MIKFRSIKAASKAPEDKEVACLEFFDVSDVSGWRNAYRGALEMAVLERQLRLAHIRALLPSGFAEARSKHHRSVVSLGMQISLRSATAIKALTWKKSPDIFIPKLRELCAECGVALVIVRAPTGCRASGATRFLSESKALLLLSFRYLSDDHFWFTFFHEAGHLLLHGKKALFLEGANMVSTDQEEKPTSSRRIPLFPWIINQRFLLFLVTGAKS